MHIRTRITELLGIRYPIVQAGMSWASSSSLLAATVSKAGGLGVIAAGPMRPDDLRRADAIERRPLSLERINPNGDQAIR